jgi:hypothetical protein
MPVIVAVVLIMILGIVSFLNISTDLLPSINLPFSVIITPYGGASPEEVEMVKVKLWKPSRKDLTIAEKLLFDIFLRLSAYERKLIFLRCGNGFKKSYRKCGKVMNVHHEVFRQEFQQVIDRVQKILDEE